LQDICDCAAFYADKISEKAERMCETGSSQDKKFEIRREVSKYYESILGSFRM
jgi:hypothetical protein